MLVALQRPRSSGRGQSTGALARAFQGSKLGPSGARMTKRLLLALATAALAACGVGSHVSSAAAGAACTGCHGDATRAGSALLQAAPPISPHGGDGGAHLAHLERGVACGACHIVPTSPAHSNGVVEVRFSGAAVAHGATPSYYANGTCSGVYCHGAPPPSHAPTSTACHDCHPGTVKADGTIDYAGGLHANGMVDAAGSHPQGWSDPAQHGAAAKTALTSCKGCHGTLLDGVGGTGPSCATCHAAAGYPSWQTNCTFCHGAKQQGVYDPSSLASAAPPRGTAGETATTTVAVGAHARHLAGGAIGPAVACTDCHVVPTSLAHLDGIPAVTFGAGATRGGATPIWNGATCASTYCHGATIAGGTNKKPSWTGGSPEAACGTCHTGYTATSVNPALHMNGTIDATSTHPAGWAAKAQHGYAATQGGLASCKGCHGTLLDGVGGTGPSCTACHATNGFASWATSCTFCHGDRTSGLASPPVDRSGQTATSLVSVGAHAAHMGTALMTKPACTTCHPDRTGSNVITDTTHVDGGNAPVVLGALAKTGGAAASYTRTSTTQASCATVYCHGAFTGGAGGNVAWTSPPTATCTTCHGAPPSTGHHGDHAGRSCGDCHPGYSTTTVVAATHVDGVKQVGNQITAWNPSTRQCTGCHGTATW